MTKIALFQSNTGVDPEANARALVEAIGKAADGGAEILFTPEMSGLLDRDSERAAKSLRREENDQVLAAAQEAARSNHIWVSLGSLGVLSDTGKVANRAFVIDREGVIRARYDKIHLFDVDLPTGESWRESNVYSAGAETIAVPAAFTVPTGQAHWHVLLRARAIEAGLFVVAAAQVGTHADGRSTFGHSLVVDPWGEIVLDMGERVGVGFATIDLGRIGEVRSRLPALSHRRAVPEAVTL
jgi:predicted amidohydrolase